MRLRKGRVQRFGKAFDPTGEALLAFSGTLTPRTIPSTVVLDRRGRIAATVIGPIPSKGTFTDLVREVAGEPGDGSTGGSTEGGRDG